VDTYGWQEGRPDANRPRYLRLLGSEWLPAIPHVHARLSSDPPARVADLGVGSGWSSIAMARAYPRIHVDGFDLDAVAIGFAAAHAAEFGVDDRVTFLARDASDHEFAHRYDLVTVFEALHDLSRPVEALRAVRGMLAEGGSLVVADERVPESFQAPGSDFDRYIYGWSVMSCLPASMTDPQSAATGAVMRPDTLRAYARDAGFERVEILPIESFEWRFYRLVP
jgi:2-polyprenyl-3-methyl-5-hydroxy-6-metoxy-1,4-benzoquinol methylase